jgi:hypothetical protein
MSDAEKGGEIDDDERKRFVYEEVLNTRYHPQSKLTKFTILVKLENVEIKYGSISHYFHLHLSKQSMAISQRCLL